MINEQHIDDNFRHFLHNIYHLGNNKIFLSKICFTKTRIVIKNIFSIHLQNVSYFYNMIIFIN